VLVIDDNEDVRILLEHQIRRLGHRVLQAADGQAGLDLAAKRSPRRDPARPVHARHRRARGDAPAQRPGSSAAVVVMSG
jgi:CheY-like chemotaxis protein